MSTRSYRSVAICRFVMLVLLLAAATGPYAQDYPTKPIRAIVPSASSRFSALRSVAKQIP